MRSVNGLAGTRSKFMATRSVVVRLQKYLIKIANPEVLVESNCATEDFFDQHSCGTVKVQKRD